MLNNLIVWTLAGRLFDVRQGRRFFGMINTSFWIGAIPTGSATAFPGAGSRPVGRCCSAAAAVSCGIAFAELVAIARAFSLSLARQIGEKGLAREPVAAMLRDRYMQLLFVATVFGWLAFYAIDNIFYDLASQRFPGCRRACQLHGPVHGNRWASPRSPSDGSACCA